MTNFKVFYQKFCESINNFLLESQEKLNSKMRAVSTPNTTQSGEHANPLMTQLNKLQNHRKQMEDVEKTIADIYSDYNRSSINDGKKILEHILIDNKKEEAKRFITINHKVLSESLEQIIQMVEKESKEIRIIESEIKQPSKTEYGTNFYRKSAQNRMFSPAIWEKLNPNKDQISQNQTTKTGEEAKNCQNPGINFWNKEVKASLKRNKLKKTKISLLN